MAQTPLHLRRNRWLFIGLFFAVGWLSLSFDRNIAAGQVPQPTPTLDRLATPVLPPSPQPRDFGQQVYYLNCMPCHGDVGQGLTDEWREVWEEDHQDCWASGCHGGRAGDEGFPVPHTIPAVIGVSPILEKFHTPEELYDYLRLTHPPQRPGKLSDADYRNVTALLWQDSGRTEPTPTATVTPPLTSTARPATTDMAPAAPSSILPLVVGLMLIAGTMLVAIKRRGRSVT